MTTERWTGTAGAGSDDAGKPPPLRLACPECGELLADVAEGERAGLHCPRCDTLFPILHGVPQFVTGDDYWGEIPAPDMECLIADLERVHWRTALDEHPAVLVRQKASFIADHRRANWIYDVPLDRRRARAIDIGCGMGSVAAALAPHVAELVALESVELRAEFCRRRFAQDGLDHVRVVRGDGLKVPFPPGSFDLIVLNGVLEWLAHGQPGEPRAVQLAALERLCALLRPDGYLVVAIENRTGIGSFRGRIDHNYLKYTALMPRWLADRITRARQGHPYDTYTYTWWGYQQLLRAAGFDNVRTLLPIWGYNRPDFLVPPKPQVGREMTRMLQISRHRASRVPMLRRLERRLRFTRLFAEDFLFLARRGSERRTPWLRSFLAEHWREWELAGDPARLELVVVNRAIPSCLVFAGGVERPPAVVKMTTIRGAGVFSAPVGEIDALRRIAPRLSALLRELVPRPLALVELEGNQVAVTSHLGGQPVRLPPGPADAPRMLAAVSRLTHAGLEWLRQFGDCVASDPVTMHADELVAACRGGGRHLGPEGPAMEAAALDLLRRRWPAAGLELRRVPQHGDFAISNLLDLGGRLAVIDWERFGRIDFPGFDALHFTSYLSVIAVASRGWEPGAAMQAFLGPGRLGEVLRPPLESYLGAIGFDAGELGPMLAAYILAYAREYGADPGRRGMMEVVTAQLAAVLELTSATRGPGSRP